MASHLNEVSEPTYPKSPSFFHRITISSSLFRSFSSPCTATFAIEPPSDSDRVPAAVYYTNLCVDCCTFNDYRAIISILRDFSIKSTSAASTSMSAFVRSCSGSSAVEECCCLVS
ncbi:hypothetical protein JHK82_031049 [Glycine max]|nr:hypothetical protein JHK85_031695 [Glycine max]KAG5124312.1 hypothetical protein JHK82_031049 [Glycine max]